MGKRKTSLGSKKMNTNTRKTAKRTAVKKAMLAERASKDKYKRNKNQK